MRRCALPLLVIAGVGGLALAGCTPGTAPAAPRTVSSKDLGNNGVFYGHASTTSPVGPAIPSSSSTVVPAPPASSIATPSPSPPPVTVTSTAAPRSTCRSVTVRVIRGSADRGREFAALQFTNTGSTNCVLGGYPVVTLRLSGRTIGTPSQPIATATSQYDLAPGDTAESRLNDYTDCSAPLSDEIHVVVPGSTQNATRPGQLRACTLRVSPLGRPE